MGRGRRMTDLAQTLHELTSEVIQLRNYKAETDKVMNMIVEQFPDVKEALGDYVQKQQNPPKLKKPKVLKQKTAQDN